MLPGPEPIGPCREPLGIPLTLLQAKSVLQWDRFNRPHGVRASIVLDHAAAEEVVEIAFESPLDPWWCIVRRPDGRFLLLDLSNDATREFASVQSALRHVTAQLRSHVQIRCSTSTTSEARPATGRHDGSVHREA